MKRDLDNVEQNHSRWNPLKSIWSFYSTIFSRLWRVGVRDDERNDYILLFSPVQCVAAFGLFFLLAFLSFFLNLQLRFGLVGDLLLVAGYPIALDIPKQLLPWRRINRKERYYVRWKPIIGLVIAHLAGFLLGGLCAGLLDRMF